MKLHAFNWFFVLLLLLCAGEVCAQGPLPQIGSVERGASSTTITSIVNTLAIARNAGTGTNISFYGTTTNNVVSATPFIEGKSAGTNFFAVYTNGGITLGRKESVLDYWGRYPATVNGDLIIAVNDVSKGDVNEIELELAVVSSADNVRGAINALFQTNHADIQLYAAVSDLSDFRTSLWNVHKNSTELNFRSDAATFLKFLPDKLASLNQPSYRFNTAVYQTNTQPLFFVQNFGTNKFVVNNDGYASFESSVNATNGFAVGAAVGMTTNINVLIAGGTTNQWQFTKGILTGVVPQ